MLSPQLIGEALHVYACRWLSDVTRDSPGPETSTSSETTQESVNRKKQFETIISLIPEDKGSVSLRFLLKLLSMAKLLGASPVISTQLTKKCSLQLEEATLNDLMLPSSNSSGEHLMYDIELVEAVVEGFDMEWRKSYARDEHSLHSIRKAGKLIDSYLQVVSTNANMSVQKFVSLANALPELARSEHDNLYTAINIYLNEHPHTSKEEKKHLCSVLDCNKLSAEACAHAVKNERLPLRTIVQVLFTEYEKHDRKETSHNTQSRCQEPAETATDCMKRLQLCSREQSTKTEAARRRSSPRSTSQKLEPESEQKTRSKKVRETGSDMVRGIMEEGSKEKLTNRRIQRSKSGHGPQKGK